MHVPPHATLHFRTRLILEVDEPERRDAVADEVREAVRWWAARTLPREEEKLRTGRFAQGGLVVASMAHSAELRTLRASTGTRGNGSGDLWAFQTRIRDRTFDSRLWAHEVAVAPAGPGSLRVSVRVRHWLSGGRLGWHPPDPAPEAPSYLWRIAPISGVRMTDGHAELCRRERPLPLGEGPDFVRRLEAPGRRSPILYLSVTRPGDRPLLDPRQVVRAVAFMANVVVAESVDLDEELDHFLPDGLRCFGGAVRLYRPGFQRPSRRDARSVNRQRDEAEAQRHRYLSPTHLRGQSSGASLVEIAREVVSAIPMEDHESEPVTLEEVEAAGARFELDRLRSETRELRVRARGGLSPEESSKLLALAERLDERVRRLEDENRRMAGELFRYAEEGNGASPQGGDDLPTISVRERSSFHGLLRELPTTAAECLALAGAMYPDRLLVTERAERSAGETAFDDPRVAWRLLMAMAGTLHELHFGEGAADRSALEIREAFRDRTPFDVAFTESKSTKATARLVSERRMRYRGEEVDLVWHVKYGTRPPRLLRAHYHPDAENGLLVLGHFGDHLETAGTARRG